MVRQLGVNLWRFDLDVYRLLAHVSVLVVQVVWPVLI